MTEGKKKTQKNEVVVEEEKQTTSYSRSPSSSSSSSPSSSSDERSEYVVQDLRDRLKSSRGSRFDLIENELGLNSAQRKFSSYAILHGIRCCFSKDCVIHPDNRFDSDINLFDYDTGVKKLCTESQK